jgi:hypothetical protein
MHFEQKTPGVERLLQEKLKPHHFIVVELLFQVRFIGFGTHL